MYQVVSSQFWTDFSQMKEWVRLRKESADCFEYPVLEEIEEIIEETERQGYVIQKGIFRDHNDESKNSVKVQKKTVQEIIEDLYSQANAWADLTENCMHRTCKECHGTGKKKNGAPCIHFISCPCPRCNPSY